MFNVRLVTLDHYLSKPVDEIYDNKSVVKEKQEPVLRIFGPTSDGFKSCVHVHGVYPYMYIPYKGGENPDRDALLIGAALDEALKISLNANLVRFVHDVILVSGIPLYGYHSKPRQFFKIYFYNPYHIKKASELLLSGAILGQKFQPHEAHIPYALQFMMDYNIYGMSFVTFSKVKYRRNPDNPDYLIDVREEDILSDKVKKITCSRLEVDALASDIIYTIGQKGIGINPGLRSIWESEKDRRRGQKKKSQFTVQQSQSRSETKICATEAFYKVWLSEKLKQTSHQESRIIDTPCEPVHSYPAEVPETRDLFEASAIVESIDRLLLKEPIYDLNSLIDQRILSQIVGSEKEKVGNESEEDEIEVDSIIGRNQKVEEAELEEEEGVDMTQPLTIDEEIISRVAENGDEPGITNTNSEETFWNSMANKIFQLDGAQESSSESEAEINPSATISEESTSATSLELTSAWSSNIMSILSEDSGCPTPSTLCQTPRTFWSNYSPNWLPQNQDSWTWNKSNATHSESTGKNQEEVLSFGDFSDATKDYISGEPYDFFVSNDDECPPASSITPFCSAESMASPPSDILTPGSEAGGSDFNLDSICENFYFPIKSEKCALERKFTETKRTFNRKPEDDRQKCLQVLKSFAGKKIPSETDCDQLTLKQYIKNCEEIVSIDFKNLCNQEMILIEYKTQNKRSLKNKYLIKPLDKFLESWNSAERKAGDRRLSKNEHRPKIVDGFNIEENKNIHSAVINVLEERFSDSSRIQSVRNKLTLKAMEILPKGGSGRKDRNYNVNQNVISQGKIKMKLIKSQRENLEKNLVEGKLKRQKNEKCFKLDLNKINAEKRKGILKAKKKQGIQREGIQRSRIVGKFNKWKKLSEPDSKLINEINSSFEEYFKSVIQRKSISRKNINFIEDMYDSKKETVKEEEEEEEEKEEEEEEEEEEKEEKKTVKKVDVSSAKKRHIQHNQTSSGADPVKFVSRFLAAFSRMSDIPPLSITISLGNPQIPVPIQMNLQPIGTSLEKEVNYCSKKQRRKVTLENVDGPADDSSSEESSSAEPTKVRTCDQKRAKREGYYKPLNVVVYSSPSECEKKGKKRNVSACGNLDKEERAKGKKRKRSFLTHPVEDRFDFYREKPNSLPHFERKKEKNSSQNQVKSSKDLEKLNESSFDKKFWGSKKHPLDSRQKQNFIDDPNGEKKRRSLKLPKTKSKALLKNIPQADTEMCSSSDDDGLRCIHKQILKTENRNLMFKSKEINKNNNEERAKKVDEITDEITFSDNVLLAGLKEKNFQEIKHFFQKTGISCCSELVSSVNSTKKLLSQPTYPSLVFSADGSPDFQLFPIDRDSADSECSAPPFSKILIHTERVNSSDITNQIWNSLESLQSSYQKGKDFECSKLALKVDGDSLDWVIGCKTIRPKQKPLVWGVKCESILQKNIFEREENAPFYSDPHDESKAVQMGPRFLKVKNRSVARLKYFESSLDILGIEERNTSTKERNTCRCWLVGNDSLRITPLVKPPSLGTALKWLFIKNNSETLKKVLKKPKIKLVNPLSPDQKSESDEEMEVTMTISSLSGELETGGPPTKEEVFENSFLTKSINSYDKKMALKKSTNSANGKQLENLKTSLRRPFSDGASSSKDCKTSRDVSFQIRQVSLGNINSYGFTHSVENLQNAKPNGTDGTHQYMSILAMELHVQTRKDLRPDPEYDPINALFYAVTFDSPVRNPESGILVIGEKLFSKASHSGHSIYYFSTEKALIEKFLDLVKLLDPEILAGYEIEMHSWGYLVQRGFILKMNLLFLLGRVQTEDFFKKNPSNVLHSGEDGNDVPRSVSNMRISGRIVLDVWRILRHEVSLTNYSFENVMYHLLQERHPLFSYESLSQYWDHINCRYRYIVIEHYITRAVGVIRILDQLDFVNRTSELSRLFGIQFYEVLSRGSQFRVESMMLRLAKPLNYVPASPSVAQRAAMRAPASLPLILEPESLFYSDPIVVLDFQSLYPSIIIAYNYCFSTCLGRVENLGGLEPFEFGCTRLQISPEEVRSLENNLSISPAGVAFVKANVRKGILPTMLEEILEARLMVKKSMRENKENKVLQKILFARQLGLKLIANVTYGYTAANFSGRMPCIEVGDSVVSKARETLHRAIQLVKNTQKWGAKVVYGDTDSIFVLIPGRSRQEAFKIGTEIADAVTQDNPKPIKLKVEKVYQPSILQTKKRYVGYMFESPDQEKPVFDAKGIETVRRDGCAAAGKILQTALQILFDTRDMSLVKKYTVRQFAKLFQDRLNMQDLIFAKEYRGRKGYRPGACVPALYLAKKWTQFDKRAEPRVKERVPYVIANGPPGVPLIQLVHSPNDLLTDPSLRINAIYYITKAIIPPMQRCFSLLGVDVTTWFAEMPRKYHKIYKSNWTECQKRNTISQYFVAAECVACCEVTNALVCSECEKQPQSFVVRLSEKIRRWERCHEGVLTICRSCCGKSLPLGCVSLDCPVFFRRKQAERVLEQGAALREILVRYF